MFRSEFTPLQLAEQDDADLQMILDDIGRIEAGMLYSRHPTLALRTNRPITSEGWAHARQLFQIEKGEALSQAFVQD